MLRQNKVQYSNVTQNVCELNKTLNHESNLHISACLFLTFESSSVFRKFVGERRTTKPLFQLIAFEVMNNICCKIITQHLLEHVVENIQKRKRTFVFENESHLNFFFESQYKI